MQCSFMNGDRLPVDLRLVAESLLKDVLQLVPELRAMWVHGSLGFGDYVAGVSDVDLLFVTEEPLSSRQRFLLAELFAERSLPGQCPIEVSFVTRVACVAGESPFPYEFHFSEDIRNRLAERVEAGRMCRELAAPTQGDPDLAAHFLVTRAVGFALWGEEPKAILREVPAHQVQEALDRELGWGRKILGKKPHYLPLNLARRAAWMCEGKVLSKLQGAAWALDKVSPATREILKGAVLRQRGQEVPMPEEQLLEAVAELEQLPRKH